MVGIVIVSHSARLAEGVAELAREMGGSEVAVEVAGGLDEPGRPIGTDAALVARAIDKAGSGDGVLVLMDLGSAVMSAEMALEMTEGAGDEVLLCAAPLVEGAVSAAAATRAGASLQDAAAEARRALDAKAAHLGEDTTAPAQTTAPPGTEAGARELRLRIGLEMGLHARPAARIVQSAARFDADVSVSNATTGRGPASARSLSGIATLGVLRGHELVVRAGGPQADEALEALRRLAQEGFGEAGARPAEGAPGSAQAAREQEMPQGALTGAPASPGIGVGPARLWHVGEPEVPEEPAAEPAEEWASLERALERTRERLARARDDAAERLGPQEADIFEAQMLLLSDEALLEPARAAVLDRKEGAAAAFKRAARATQEAYDTLENELQRARAADVADVARRVLLELVGDDAPANAVEVEGVLVAADLTPGDVAGLDAERVAALVTARGGPTSHGAILARAAGIPAVVGAGDAVLAVQEGTELAVDGSSGTVWIAPTGDELGRLQERRRAWESDRLRARAAARAPAVTRDGERIAVLANAGSLSEVEAAVAAGAEGIGLLRTEFMFLGRRAMPDEDEQAAAYSAAAEALDGRPLVLRTLDAGADKPLSFLDQTPEDNPYLGVRGIRLGLARPDALRTQLRAAARSAARHPVKILLPMVATVDELRRAQGLLDEARAKPTARGDSLPRPALGAMIEIPGAALDAERLACSADFLSLGTNDLAQYTMAAERGNESVAWLADALHPAVLRLIEMTCRGARACGKSVSVCGEAAGDPGATAILIGLGVRELSMSPGAVADVKQAVRSIDAARARALAVAALRCGDATEVRALVARETRP